MSLFRQLQGLITLLLISTLIIVLKINFDNARLFTFQQLFHTGKNIANTLALSLSFQANDRALMEASLNAMFDGGNFEEISLIGQDGEVLYRRQKVNTVDGVPPVFIDIIDLQVPVAKSLVNEAWTIMGTLQVKVSPNEAYQKLWDILKKLSIALLVLGCASIAISYVILRFLLTSLEAIKRQAEAISYNEYIINNSIPKVPELKKVTIAMNTMVKKSQTTYKRQLEYLKNYNKLKFKDIKTGLYNRTFLIKQLDDYLNNYSGNGCGHVIFIGISGMESLKISPDHPIFNSLFEDMANRLVKEAHEIADTVPARLTLLEFACILPNCSAERTLAIAKETITQFQELISLHPELNESIGVYGGVTSYHTEDTLHAILSRADYALATAKSGLSGSVDVYKAKNNRAVLGKIEWKEMIEDALVNERFTLISQPVMSESGELHQEVTTVLRDRSGVEYEANHFMPMVLTLGITQKLDEYVFKRVVEHLSMHPERVLAISISTETCKNNQSVMRLKNILPASSSMTNNIIFQVHENALIQYPDICLALAEYLRSKGYRLGIDQFTMNSSGLNLLSELKPDYIKVPQSYLLSSVNPEEKDLILNSLLTITESLDIKLIAVNTETEAQRSLLSEKSIHYFQGNGIASITPL